MKLISLFKKELGTLCAPLTLIGAGAGLAAGLITMIACGNLYLYRLLLLPRHAPPSFLFFFGYLLVLLLLGGCAGLMYAGRCRKKSGVFHLLTAAFVLLWYVAFMRTASFVFSVIMLLCAAVMLFFASAEAIEKRRLIAAVGSVLAGLLIVADLFLTVSVILLN